VVSDRLDRNTFATALVLRTLRAAGRDPGLEAARSRALGFLERCRSPEVPGAFGFWPTGGRPDWAPVLPPDLDDTCVCTIELLRAGRLDRRSALRTACRVLLPLRVRPDPTGLSPPWVVPGCFPTWIAPPGRRTIVDCCVNANAAALLALVGARHLPGFAEAVQTVLLGVAWAGDDPARLCAITPFYPSPRSLAEAIEHAIDCGATDLAPVMIGLRVVAGDGPPDPICADAYGRTQWRCPPLDEAWRLRAAGR
jgi:hypothetical protein